MKEMEFYSLINILLASVQEEEETKTATQDDIKKYFG